MIRTNFDDLTVQETNEHQVHFWRPHLSPIKLTSLKSLGQGMRACFNVAPPSSEASLYVHASGRYFNVGYLPGYAATGALAHLQFQ